VSQTSFRWRPGSPGAPAAAPTASAGGIGYFTTDAMVKIGRYMAIMK
jgi:hypothetical protein